MLRNIASDLELKIQQKERAQDGILNSGDLAKLDNIDSSVQLQSLNPINKDRNDEDNPDEMQVELCDGLEIIGRDF
jgi:hypothetical protein